jgi:acetoin utilization deacetylase AcuC-like enzyme
MKQGIRTAFLYHPFFLMHSTGKEHPESNIRLKHLYRYVASSKLVRENMVTMIEPQPEKRFEYLLLTHSEQYLDIFKLYCKRRYKYFEHTDNIISFRTYDVALFHAYSCLYAADLIMKGHFDKVFIAGRPPSHHAGKDYSLGFCFINNVAVTANYLLSRWNINKVLIIDIDAHHGNGTQDIFYDKKDVFYFSIHEHPSFIFPGTGRYFETGVNDGLNYTLNCPVMPGIRDEEYRLLFHESCKKIFSFFRPDIILVSAGYDTHINDGISDLSLSTDCINDVISIINNYAASYCDGKAIFFLEGGYNIESLCTCVYNTLDIISKGVSYVRF